MGRGDAAAGFVDYRYCRYNLTCQTHGVGTRMMKPQVQYPPIEGSLIQRVALVDRLVRPTPGSFCAPSLPGHLIHWVAQGEVEQEVNGQQQRLLPGTAVWYHENESVRGRILKTPWIYYTVNFTAVRLPPPPFDQRVWVAGAAMEHRFQALLDAWQDTQSPPIARHLRVCSRLLELLLDTMPAVDPTHGMDVSTHLWWELEARLREDLGREIDLKLLQSLSGPKPAFESSRHANGLWARRR